jgi:hypothetical protein
MLRDGLEPRLLQKHSGGGTRTHNLSVNSRARLPVELPRIEPPRTCRFGLGLGHCTQVRRESYMSSANPDSTSAWQLAHSSTHLLASALALSIERATPR